MTPTPTPTPTPIAISPKIKGPILPQRKESKEQLKSKSKSKSKPNLTTFEDLDRFAIQAVCQQLILQRDFTTLSSLVLTNKNVYCACHELLSRHKVARSQRHPTRTFFMKRDLAGHDIDVTDPTIYEEVIRTTPEYCYAIFAEILFTSNYHISKEVVTWFQAQGINLNLASNVYLTRGDYPHNVDEENETTTTTPLVAMCLRQDTQKIQVLCQCGADVNLRDPTGLSPFVALFSYNMSAVQLDPYVYRLNYQFAKNPFGEDTPIDPEYLKKVDQSLDRLMKHGLIPQMNRSFLSKLQKHLALLERLIPDTAQVIKATIPLDEEGQLG